MRILLAIVHHWNPEGGGRHASLRPDPTPRLHGLQDQLLSLVRLGTGQGALNIGELRVDNASHALRHQFQILLITDGTRRPHTCRPSAAARSTAVRNSRPML